MERIDPCCGDPMDFAAADLLIAPAFSLYILLYLSIIYRMRVTFTLTISWSKTISWLVSLLHSFDPNLEYCCRYQGSTQ